MSEEKISQLREPWSRKLTRLAPFGPQILREKEWRHPDTLFDLISLGLMGQGVTKTTSSLSSLFRSFLSRPKTPPPLTTQQKIEGLRRTVRQVTPHYKGEGYEISKAQWEKVQKALEKMRGGVEK